MEGRLATSHGGIYHMTRAIGGPSEILLEVSPWEREGPGRHHLLLADLLPSKAPAVSSIEKPAVLAAPQPLGPLAPGAAAWIAADAAGPGRVRVTLDGLAETRSLKADFFFGPKDIGARPKVLHLLGAYGDASLSLWFPDIDWTAVASGGGPEGSPGGEG